eukprot:g497.t1
MYLQDHYWRLNSCFDEAQTELNGHLSELQALDMLIRDQRARIGQPMKASMARTYGRFGGLLPIEKPEDGAPGAPEFLKIDIEDEQDSRDPDGDEAEDSNLLSGEGSLKLSGGEQETSTSRKMISKGGDTKLSGSSTSQSQSLEDGVGTGTKKAKNKKRLTEAELQRMTASAGAAGAPAGDARGVIGASPAKWRTHANDEGVVSTAMDSVDETNFRAMPESKYEKLAKDYCRGLAEREMLKRRFFDPAQDQSDFLSQVLQSIDGGSLDEELFDDSSLLLSSMLAAPTGENSLSQELDDPLWADDSITLERNFRDNPDNARKSTKRREERRLEELRARQLERLEQEAAEGKTQPGGQVRFAGGVGIRDKSKKKAGGQLSTSVGLSSVSEGDHTAAGTAVANNTTRGMKGGGKQGSKNSTRNGATSKSAGPAGSMKKSRAVDPNKDYLGHTHVLGDVHPNRTTLQLHPAQPGGGDLAMFGGLKPNIYKSTAKEASLPVQAARKWVVDESHQELSTGSSNVSLLARKPKAAHARYLQRLIKSRDPQKFKILPGHEDKLCEDLVQTVLRKVSGGAMSGREGGAGEDDREYVENEELERAMKKCVRKWTTDLGILATEAVDFEDMSVSTLPSVTEETTGDESDNGEGAALLGQGEGAGGQDGGETEGGKEDGAASDTASEKSDG